MILRAAGAVLGVGVSRAVDLGGSSRSTVVRCETAGGGSVIVKAFGGEPEALRCFTAEAAGLSLGIAGPEVLGVDTEVPLLVMEDLGDAPSLADVLLGDDAVAAEDGLVVWARGLGRLAVEAAERRGELRRLWARFDKGAGSWEDEAWVGRNAAELLGVVDSSAVPGLAEELAWIGTAGGEEYPVFTPGDTCPDNNLFTPDGLRLIDFEAACYQSAFLVAAYCRMPFSSCWCVFSLPSEVAARVEAAYRAEVVSVYPALADDGVWEAGVRQAVAVWTVAATAFLLPRTVEDGPLHPTRRPAPSRRQLLKHRWEKASELEEFPAFAEAMRWLSREVAGGWDVAPLAGYPAFGGSL